MKLRRFNNDGVARFAAFRSQLALEPTLPPPLQLLEDPALTEIVAENLDVDSSPFQNRLEAGRYLNEMLDKTGISLPERDRGLWTWLTLFFSTPCALPMAMARETRKTKPASFPCWITISDSTGTCC